MNTNDEMACLILCDMKSVYFSLTEYLYLSWSVASAQRSCFKCLGRLYVYYRMIQHQKKAAVGTAGSRVLCTLQGARRASEIEGDEEVGFSGHTLGLT